jgi:hypothetical protein
MMKANRTRLNLAEARTIIQFLILLKEQGSYQ